MKFLFRRHVQVAVWTGIALFLFIAQLLATGGSAQNSAHLLAASPVRGGIDQPSVCGTPAALAKQYFGWDVSVLNQKYRNGTAQQLCDDKIKTFTTTVCLRTTDMLQRIGWPADLVLAQYANQVICTDPGVQPGNPHPTAPPTTNTNVCQLALPLGTSIDYCVIIGQLIQHFVVDTINNASTWLIGQSQFFMFTTPASATYQNPAIVDLWKLMLALVDGFLVIVISWIGLSVATNRSWLQYADAIDLIPRVLLAVLIAHFSNRLLGLMIDGNDALCGLFVKNQMLQAIFAVKGNADTFMKFLALFYGVMGMLLVVEQVVRLALVDVLIVTAPLGLFCWVLPETQGIARVWTTAALATVFMQAIQILLLAIGGRLVSDTIAGAAPTVEVLNGLIGFGVLYLTLKVPGMLRQWTLQPGGGGGALGIASGFARAALWFGLSRVI